MTHQGGAFTAAGPFESRTPPATRPVRLSSGVELVLNAHNETGESPVWHVAEQALYWVDIPARALHRWRAADQRHDVWYADEQISCIARAPNGQWIAGMESGVFLLAPGPDGRLAGTPVALAEHARAGMRFNDGRCDRQGRLWAGTMLLEMSLYAPVGALYRLHSGGAAPRLEPILGDLVVPNGMAFSPDGRTMYLSDSTPSRQKVWSFDYDIDSGMPSGRRVFIDKLASGRPDGAAIDEDGGYWICGTDAGQIHRYTPDGRLDRSLSVPVAKPTMCAFGGRNLDTLFVTSIRRPTAEPAALDGAVFALRPGVRGIEEPDYRP
jgi:sugar lactone lactonase YvrE